MARKLIKKDEKNGVYVAHFEPKGGWKPGKNGIRRTMCKISELAHLDVETRANSLTRMYNQLSWEIQNADKLKDEKQKKLKNAKKLMTIRQAAKLWLDEVEQINGKKTFEAYTKTINYYKECEPDHPINDFDRGKNIKFFKFLESCKYRGRPLVKTTQNYHMRQFQRFLNWAYENEILERSFSLKKQKRPKKDIETYGIEHLKTLKDYIDNALKKENRPREILNLVNMRRAFVMATKSLLRIGAIDAMLLDWVDMKERLIRVVDNQEREFQSKASKNPNKPINDDLFEFLESDLKNRSPEERYFLDNGKGQPWLRIPVKAPSHFGFIRPLHNLLLFQIYFYPK